MSSNSEDEGLLPIITLASTSNGDGASPPPSQNWNGHSITTDRRPPHPTPPEDRIRSSSPSPTDLVTGLGFCEANSPPSSANGSDHFAARTLNRSRSSRASIEPLERSSLSQLKPRPPPLRTANLETELLDPQGGPSPYLALETPSNSTWVFGNHSAPSPLPPKSPSYIHPSYGVPPSPYGLPPSSFTTEDHRPSAMENGHVHRASSRSLSMSRSPNLGPPSSKSSVPSGPISPNFADGHSRSLSVIGGPPSVSLRSQLLRRLDTPACWLVLYFCANLALTRYNKFGLVAFPFPWTLTGVHTLFGAAGARALLSQGAFVPQRLSRRESAVLVAFSGLYTINIAVSNLSLNLVTVPFHQVVRAMTPLFTIALSTIFLGKRHSPDTYVSLVPVVIGVGFATYGDYYFTAWGLFLTLIGTGLAALKTIATNMILVGRLKLHPLDLLLRMSPLAFVQCVICAWWSGEMAKVREFGHSEMTQGKALALFVNGGIAFLLNVVSFSANKKTSPLTMTVAANVKQVLTILLAVVIFNLHVTWTNLFGIIVTLSGGVAYATVEYRQKSRLAAANSSRQLTSSSGKAEQLATVRITDAVTVGEVK